MSRRPLRRLAAACLSLVSVACSESTAPEPSPSAPPPPAPKAELVMEGEGQWIRCVEPLFCGFLVQGRNIGEGCAQMNLGIAWFLDAEGNRVGTDFLWRDETVSSFFLRPGEAFTFETTSVPWLTRIQAEATQIRIDWTDVRCDLRML